VQNGDADKNKYAKLKGDNREFYRFLEHGELKLKLVVNEPPKSAKRDSSANEQDEKHPKNNQKKPGTYIRLKQQQ
ncbi:unnamed protein product, partial [Didymodactylos carnosus]